MINNNAIRAISFNCGFFSSVGEIESAKFMYPIDGLMFGPKFKEYKVLEFYKDLSDDCIKFYVKCVANEDLEKFVALSKNHITYNYDKTKHLIINEEVDASYEEEISLDRILNELYEKNCKEVNDCNPMKGWDEVDTGHNDDSNTIVDDGRETLLKLRDEEDDKVSDAKYMPPAKATYQQLEELYEETLKKLNDANDQIEDLRENIEIMAIARTAKLLDEHCKNKKCKIHH